MRNTLLILAVVVLGCGKPPQIGADEAAFKSVDALYTAITSRRIPLLDQCESDLKNLADAGRLPASAWSELQSIIAKAKAGSWDSAAERLYDFMKGQERPNSTRPAKSKK